AFTPLASRKALPIKKLEQWNRMLSRQIEQVLELGHAERGPPGVRGMNLVLDLLESFAVVGKIIRDPDQNLLFDHPEIDFPNLGGIGSDGVGKLGYRRRLVTGAQEKISDPLHKVESPGAH